MKIDCDTAGGLKSLHNFITENCGKVLRFKAALHDSNLGLTGYVYPEIRDVNLWLHGKKSIKGVKGTLSRPYPCDASPHMPAGKEFKIHKKTIREVEIVE